MSWPSAFVCVAALVMIFGSLTLSPFFTSQSQQTLTKSLAEVAISCNNLQAAAIAASQSAPKCAK